MHTSAREFVDSLAHYPPMANVFNPWAQEDERDQPGANTKLIRQQHLAAYIEARRTSTKVILVAEALSHRGGRFTGVAMTSERILLGNDPTLNAIAEPISLLPGPCTRTSNAERLREMTARKLGVYEKTASVVWRTMLIHGFSPTDFALWNAFPFHPFRDGNTQTNRRPTADELKGTASVLAGFISLYSPSVKVVALGREAESALLLLMHGREFERAKHPAARMAKFSGPSTNNKQHQMRGLDDVVRGLRKSIP
jgi:hypothetical protein